MKVYQQSDKGQMPKSQHYYDIYGYGMLQENEVQT